MRTITVDRAPRLGPLMAKATVTAGGRGGELPETVVERCDVRVDRDHLAAYDRVCGFTLRDTLPAPYLHVLTFGLQVLLMAERDFPLPLPGLIHVANRLELLRPVSADESLDLSVHAEGLRPHAKGRQVDLVGRATVAGETVWCGHSTYLARGDATAPAATPEPELAPSLAGDGPPTARWRLPADLGRRYAAVSGDVNPIHLHPLAAKSLGFPRTIAHGMWTLARCMASVCAQAPQTAVTEVTFRSPVLLPGTVDVRTCARDGGFDVRLSSRSGERTREHLQGTIRPL